MEQHFILAGWHKDISDDDLIRNLYLKLTLGLQWRWRNADPVVDEHLLQRCIPESFHTDKVTAFITYKNKIFLSLANGNIQRVVHNVIPSASNTSESLQEQGVPLTSETIQNAYRQVNDESHILGRYIYFIRLIYLSFKIKFPSHNSMLNQITGCFISAARL